MENNVNTTENASNEEQSKPLKQGAVISSALAKALEYLKITYYGFEDYQYEIAAKIGDETNFENMERQLVNVDYKPYIDRIGKTYHQLFLDRVEAYFINCERRKRHYL